MGPSQSKFLAAPVVLV